MYKLRCQPQNYEWGKKGLNSLVGQIYNKNSKYIN